MNKIKLLYDVVKTMKSKEILNGVVKAEVQKDQTNLFSFHNEFEKNMLTGQTKAKICTELNYEGKKIHPEGTNECTLHCHNKEWPELKHLHYHSHRHMRYGSIKKKLTKLACALSILNSMQVAEQDNKTLVISLNMEEISGELKTFIQEKISHAAVCHNHGIHDFMKDFSNMENCDCTFNVFINKNYEIEKIAITLDGTQSDEQNNPHEIKANAELCFTW